MFTIEKAFTEDFERVYPHLLQSFGDSLSKEEWRKSFVSQWRSPEDFCGYMLLQDGQVKGYLGLLFSNRILDNRIEKFCNMHSWCVSEDARGKSLSLLLEMLKLKDYTITNFTASPTVATILSRLGFTSFEVHQQVIFPLPHLRLKSRSWVCDFDLKEIRSYLNDRDQTIFDDHQHFNCEHLLLRSNGRYSYVVLKKTKRKKMPFAKVHYLSDAENFIESIESLTAMICMRLKVVGVMVDDRYLMEQKLRTSIRYPHQRKAYFKSGSAPDKNRIDTLYSELVVLHS